MKPTTTVALTLPDMSCGHCASTVTRAIHAIDAGAQVAVDLRTKRVDVTSHASRDVIAGALVAAGYPPEG